MHQTVGEMGIHHFQFRLFGLRQLLSPVSKAVVLGKSNHFHNNGRTCITENKNPAGRLILFYHIVDSLDECCYIKGIDIAQRFCKSVDQFVLNALHQRKAIAVMGVEGCPIQLRQLADLFYRDPVDWFFFQQSQKRQFEHHLCIALSRIQLFHVCPSEKSSQRMATHCKAVLLFFQPCCIC